MTDDVAQPQDSTTPTPTNVDVDIQAPAAASEQPQQQEEEPPKTKEMKICLSNLPKFIPANAVRKYVAELLKMPPSFISCKKAPKWDHAILACKTETPMEEVLERLNGQVWNKHQLAAWVDHLVPKPGGKAVLRPRAGVADRSLNDQVTPLWRMAYGEQLARKQAAMAEVVQQVGLKREGFGLAPIKPSPRQLGYRNKCEFSIGLDKEGRAAVGFSLGGFREGTVTVANASECLHVPASMKALANAFEAHIRSRADSAPILNRVTKSGFWRLLMVRSHGGRMMVVVQVQKGFLPEEAARQETELVGRLLAAFRAADDDGTLMTVGSVSVQSTAAVFHGMDTRAPYELLHGSETLTETLGGLRFQISPSSFFQVNPQATALLYDTVREYVVDALGKDVVLLDLCCGTGTIGMLMAQHVQHVYGVELVADAVEDARINARLNGIQNIEFVCGRVEDVLPAVIARIDPATPIAVVLDPPRSGVRTTRALPPPTCYLLLFV
jgi:tRNA (uracil-5-)-methyltransferase